MQLNVTGHHVDVTTSLKGYVEKKLDRIVRHSDHVIDVHCILTVEKLRHKAEATVQLTGATVYAGAVTAVGSSPKLVYSRVIKEFIGVALDRYSFSFGNGLLGNPTTSYTAGATAIVCYGPPIIVAPGGNLYFCQVSPSGASTAATFQFELGFWER